VNAPLRILRRHSVPITLIALSCVGYIGAAFATGQTMQLSQAGVVGLLQRMVALGLVALGQSFAIIGGSIDLSVGNLISVSAVLAAYFMQGRPDAIAQGVVLVLLAAALVGIVNGLLVARLKVNPLIATLGIGLVLQGILTVSFTQLRGSVPSSYQDVAYGQIAGVPISVIALFALGVAASAGLTHTVAGAHLLAVGGNADSARLAGIGCTRVLVGAHVVCSLTAGLAGLYLASWLGAATPWIGRDGGYDLGSIAAVVVGGTLLAGGRGSIGGTLAGVFVFATIDAVFNMLQINAFLGQVLRGVIVIVAVGLYTFRSRSHTA
jgi:ribose transport system permease protein